MFFRLLTSGFRALARLALRADDLFLIDRYNRMYQQRVSFR